MPSFLRTLHKLSLFGRVVSTRIPYGITHSTLLTDGVNTVDPNTL